MSTEHPIVPEPQYGLSMRARLYRCANCGHVQLIRTNHSAGCVDYCHGCSWKPSFGNPEFRVPFNGRTYRPFQCVEAPAAEIGPI